MNDQAHAQGVDSRLQIPELGRRARLRRVVGLVLLLALAAAAVAYAMRPKPVLPLYRTERVARRTIVQRVETTGIVDVRSRVDVPAPIAGRLTAIEVEPRQEVTQGELLATLDQRAAELAVRSARLTVDAAASRLAQAQAAFDAASHDAQQAKRLHDKGLASDQAVTDAQSALAGAKAALQAARADKQLAGQSVASSELSKSLSRIVAPVDGVVLLAPERVGAAVSPERGPLFEIGAPLSVMRVDAQVSETEIALLAPGQKAEVLVQALPGEHFNAKIDRIGIEPKREGGVALYPVRLLVDNPRGALLPGMSARVQLEVARATDVLAVHEAALRFDPEQAEPAAPRSRVWRLRGLNQLEPIAVEPGISDGAYTAVKTDPPGRLAAGDQLAIGLLHPELSTGKPSVSLGKK